MLDDLQVTPAAALLRVLVAGLAGGLIGVERERRHARDRQAAFGGARTFPLIAILGASLTLVTGGVHAAVIAGFAGVAGLIIASYLRTAPEHPGLSTEVAGLVTYWVGAMAGAGALVLAGSIAVTTAVLLAAKEPLARFSKTLTREELSAALTLAVLAAVILPVLPDRDLGPWGVWNPRELWLVVVLVCGLSFLAFIGMRLLGPERGVYAGGLLGGLVSSTATTVTFATTSRQDESHASELAVGAGLASLVMLGRVGLLAGLAGRDVIVALAPALAVMLVAGTIPIVVLARRPRKGRRDVGLRNPFRLASALKFGLLYAGVLLLVEAAKRRLGTSGLMVAAVLTGLTDVDAVTIAFARDRDMTPDEAAMGIVLGVVANTAAKSAYAAWLGGPGFRRAIAFILGPVLAVGVTALALAWR